METIKINPRSKAGKALEAILQILAGQPGVEIMENKSPYNPEFVKKIKRAEKRGDFIEVNPKDVWASIK
ncbi:MAG: hypothetical protein M9916_02680 [Crocinitomicaceae bacterium]|nr:hypothetical protein [Crocinitomicaceae bacterium]